MLNVIDPKDVQLIRRQLGITQARLAQLAGVSQSLIAKIEARRLDPTFSRMKAISEALTSLQTHQQRRAEDLMTPAPLITVSPNDLVGEAAAKMRRHAVSQLPVIDRDQPIGSITESSILRALAKEPRATELFRLRVETVMDVPFPTVPVTAPLAALVGLLQWFAAVLVVRGQRLVGIITKADLLKH